MKMKISDYVVEFLQRKGVDTVFEMSGGMIAHFLDSLSKQSAIKVTSMHHEQCAAFAAEGHARMTGLPCVAMATSGPGATNLLTGIGSCYFDSVPALFITGQVNRYEQKGDREVRQLGFQETDIVSMAKTITKAAWLVQTPEEVPALLEKAWVLATSGRPGPVLIDVPMDIQRSEITIPAAEDTSPPADATQDCNDFLERLFSQLKSAKRPLILVGGGVRSGRAIELFREFIEKTCTPAVCSLMGIDALPFTHPLRVGMIGSYGNRWANIALGSCDLLMVLGSRLDVRQTGSETQEFKGGRPVFHIDCEPGEMNNRVTGCETLASDLRDFFSKALHFLGTQKLDKKPDWLAEIARWRSEWPDIQELTVESGINPNVFLHQLSQSSAAAAAYVVDVGQHQMWAAQSIEVAPGQRFLTSGGMGAMGFALPTAIGSSLAAGSKPVVVIAGDGGFQLNIQELQTVVRNRLPLKIIVMNNQCHGMVRQFQESYFESRFQSTMWGYSAPDFAKVSEAYSIPARTIREAHEVAAALEWLWHDPSSAALLEVRIDPQVNVYPKLAFGRPITEMEPFSKPIGMEGT